MGIFLCVCIQKMNLYIDRLGNLGVKFPKELDIDMVLKSLYSSYLQFVMNYNRHNLNKTLIELHGVLKIFEASMIKNKSSNPISPILAIGHASANKKKKFTHGKGKAKARPPNQSLKRKFNFKIAPNIDLKKEVFYYC